MDQSIDKLVSNIENGTKKVLESKESAKAFMKELDKRINGMICKHDYKDIGYGVERCAKCQEQRVVDKQLFEFYVKHFFNEMKDKFNKLKDLV